MLNDHIFRNHDNLSPECGALTRGLCRDDGAAGPHLDLESAGVPRFLARYTYAVSPWPLLISSDTRARFGDLVREVPSLIARALLQFYGSDRAAFCARYRVPEIVFESLAETRGDMTDLLVRCDLALVDSQPRVLEMNVGSKIGGWQVSWLWPYFADMLARREESRSWRPTYTHTIEALFRHLHRALHTHVNPAGDANILILIDSFYDDPQFHDALRAIYARVAEGPGRATLTFDVGFDGINFSGPDGYVEHRGAIVHCLLVTSTDLHAPKDASRAHHKRRLFYPDTALFRLLADKSNFAILHTLRAGRQLSPHDAQLVDDYIPWAALLNDEAVERHGDKTTARALALARRPEFVLKKGLSNRGRHVFVGRFVPEDEWAAAVDKAAASGDWILQDYCAPDRLYAPSDGPGVAEHSAIWGVFGFGNAYGGAFARLLPEEEGQGVVNSARGAKESAILEV